MANAEMDNYNKAVEKLCTDCAAEVGKQISSCRTVVSTRMGKLAADIEKLKVPNSAGKDLEDIPDLVNSALKRGGSRFASVATFGVRVEVQGNKVSVPAAGISGPLAGVV
ncbi:MAG TPA: hypothetical protein VFE51_12560 [Verrucomicrobiae bacterium]|nr:hypothetical protein [Verrucomicrobiae bacterium]